MQIRFPYSYIRDDAYLIKYFEQLCCCLMLSISRPGKDIVKLFLGEVIRSGGVIRHAYDWWCLLPGGVCCLMVLPGGVCCLMWAGDVVTWALQSPAVPTLTHSYGNCLGDQFSGYNEGLPECSQPVTSEARQLCAISYVVSWL